jgi:hypothetical protein
MSGAKEETQELLAEGIISVSARLDEPISLVGNGFAGPIGAPAMMQATKARRRPPLRQSDVKRAMKAAQAAGVSISAVHIAPDGTITLVPGAPTAAASEDRNPWDDLS